MEDYRQFQPKGLQRTRENIEWTIAYSYNARDCENPRVLLIGDSICHQYHGEVRKNLADCANISYWASSKCVTDPDYFRQLDFYLDAYRYDMICFNNGLHSLVGTDLDEWKIAYEAVLAFMQAKHPQAKVSLVLSTPPRDDRKADILTVKEINQMTVEIAEKWKLPVVDLFTPMDALDKWENMTDTLHFAEPAKAMQGEIMAEHIRRQLTLQAGGIAQTGSETGPDGAID